LNSLFQLWNATEKRMSLSVPALLSVTKQQMTTFKSSY
jgi:hypothetical protein